MGERLEVIITATDELSAVVDGITGSLGKLGLVAGGALIGAITGIGTAAFAAGLELDEAFDNMRVATGATGDELSVLEEDFRQVFTSIPTEAGPASDVISSLNQRLGLTGESLQGLATPLLEATRLLGGDAKTNAELFTRVMGDWGVSNEDAAGTLDMMFAASQQTGIGMDNLMGKVVQFGSPMRLMGFSIEETAALFGKFEQEGVNAELVMGSLRIAAGKFARENIPLKDGLTQTMEAIAGATDESEALALGMEVFGARAGPDMTAAIREGRFSIDEMVASLQNADGAIMSASEDTADFGERLTVFKNKATVALEPLGMALMDVATMVLDQLKPAIDSVVPVITTFAEKVGSLVTTLVDAGPLSSEFGEALGAIVGEGTADAILNIAQAISDFVTGSVVPFIQDHGPLLVQILGAVAVAFGAFTVISSVVSWIGGLIAAVTGFLSAAGSVTGVIGAIVGILGGPLTLVIAAVAALIGGLALAWVNDWGGMREIVANVVAVVSSTVQTFVSNIRSWFTEHQTEIQTIIQTVWGLVQSVIQSVITVVGPAIQTFIDGVKTAFQNVGPAVEAFKMLFAALGPFITTIAAVVGGIIVGLIGVVVGLFSGIANAIAPFIQTVIAVVTSIVTILTGVINVITGILQTIYALFTGNQELLQSATEMFSTGLQEIWTGLTTGIVSLVTGLWETVVALVQGLVEGVIGFFTTLYQTLVGGSIVPDLVNGIVALFTFLSDTAKAIWEGIQTAIETVAGLIKGFIDGWIILFQDAWNIFLGVLQTAWDTVWNAIQTIGETIWGLIKGAVDTWIGLFQEAWDFFLGALQTAWDTGWNAIQTIGETIWGLIKGAVDGFISLFQGAWDLFLGVLQTAWDTAWGAIQTAGETIWGLIQGAIDLFISGAQTAWDTFLNAAGGLLNLWEVAWDAIKAAGDEIVGLIQEAIQGFIDLVKGIWEGFLQGGGSITDVWANAWETILGKVQGITSKIQEAIGGIAGWVADAIAAIASLGSVEVPKPKGGGSSGSSGSTGSTGTGSTSTTTTTTTPKTKSKPGTMVAVASGGPVFPGQNVLAGESIISRPEVFVPATPGYVLTRQDAQEAFAKSILGKAGGSMVPARQTIIYNSLTVQTSGKNARKIISDYRWLESWNRS